MIKLRVETVARDGRPTLPGRIQFQESGRRNRLERGCQGTGSIVENQIQKRRSKEGLLNLFDQAGLLHTRRIAGNSPSVSEALERQS